MALPATGGDTIGALSHARSGDAAQQLAAAPDELQCVPAAERRSASCSARGARRRAAQREHAFKHVLCAPYGARMRHRAQHARLTGRRDSAAGGRRVLRPAYGRLLHRT